MNSTPMHHHLGPTGSMISLQPLRLNLYPTCFWTDSTHQPTRACFCGCEWSCVVSWSAGRTPATLCLFERARPWRRPKRSCGTPTRSWPRGGSASPRSRPAPGCATTTDIRIRFKNEMKRSAWEFVDGTQLIAAATCSYHPELTAAVSASWYDQSLVTSQLAWPILNSSDDTTIYVLFRNGDKTCDPRIEKRMLHQLGHTVRDMLFHVKSCVCVHIHATRSMQRHARWI